MQAESARRAEVVIALREHIAWLSRGRLMVADVDPSAHVLDAGYVDSLSVVELFAFVERRFGVRLAEVQLGGRVASLDAIADTLTAQVRGE